jgi:hypothetical protein
MLSILLSHSSRDRFLVQKLAERLRAHDVNVCLDETEISIGDALADKPSRYVCVSDSVGVVLTGNSVTSNWVNRELRAVLKEEESRRRVNVLPILFGSVDIPDFLKTRQVFDFTTPERLNREFPRLLEALGVTELNPRVEDVPGPEMPPSVGKAPVPLPATGAARATPSTTDPESPFARRLGEFQDILITGLNAARTRRPDPNQPIYDFYFDLSGLPPNEWEEVFEAERRFSTPTPWRKVWFELEYLVVRGIPEELDGAHFARLRTDIARTNQRYRQHFTEIAEREAARLRQTEREQKLIEDISHRLKFN